MRTPLLEPPSGAPVGEDTVVGAPVFGVAEDAEDTVVATGVPTFIGATGVLTFIGANVVHGLDDDDAMDFALGSLVCIKIFYSVWYFT